MVRSSKAAAKQPLFAWTNMGSSSTGGKQIINEGRYFPIWWAFGVEMNPELDHVFALTYVTSQRLLGLASGENARRTHELQGQFMRPSGLFLLKPSAAIGIEQIAIDSRPRFTKEEGWAYSKAICYCCNLQHLG
jgi:hypothetical protein